uniref:Uncharacterized protein n=1 Tax=Myotis myotis TaxID=51298 RepID=A0A7J7Z554_MYOMY|nr:hypothetical protein mMyoMyo1_010627 [Myotis myotis]
MHSPCAAGVASQAEYGFSGANGSLLRPPQPPQVSGGWWLCGEQCLHAWCPGAVVSCCNPAPCFREGEKAHSHQHPRLHLLCLSLPGWQGPKQVSCSLPPVVEQGGERWVQGGDLSWDPPGVGKGPSLGPVGTLGSLAKQALVHTNSYSAIYLQLFKLAPLPHLSGETGSG